MGLAHLLGRNRDPSGAFKSMLCCAFYGAVRLMPANVLTDSSSWSIRILHHVCNSVVLK